MVVNNSYNVTSYIMYGTSAQLCAIRATRRDWGTLSKLHVGAHQESQKY